MAEIRGAPVRVEYDLKKKKISVVASKDAEAGAIRLPPCAPKAAKVFHQSTHPHRVRFLVTCKAQSAVAAASDNVDQRGETVQESVYFAIPGLKPPSIDEESADAPTDAMWVWKGDETMCPFWAVRRLTGSQLAAEQAKSRAEPSSPHAVAFNCGLQDFEFTQVCVGAFLDDSVSYTQTVRVPMLTNTARVREGEELILEVVERQKEKKRVENWRDDIRKAAKQAKIKPKASPNQASNDLEV